MTLPPVSPILPVAEPAVVEVPEVLIEAVTEPNATDGTIENPYGAVDVAPHDLKRKTARGALVSTFGQASNFVLRIGSMVILARLLTPEDFGLVGMVTACTGFLGLFRDAGLSMATVQRASISREQTSMLFWINLAVGLVLTALCAVVAPFLTRFYHEPRLFWVTVGTGAGFIFNGAAAQHRAVMQRDMRFIALTVIDLVALVVSVVVGIGMAAVGLRYWALVGMAVSLPIVGTFGVWALGGWMPGPPRRGVEVLSMLRYGGTVTLNTVIVYIAYNMDKVLLGRFWGAEILGIYGRAYQLISLPTENLNSTISLVAFPALSRLQHDPERLKSYFLKGYGLFLSLVIPITMACGLFADDIVQLFLGSKWGAAVPVFRLLAPTILAFALINPHGWLLLAAGRATRSLKIAFFIAPCVILGYVAGLGLGSQGVAAGFSISMMLVVIPVILWSTHGTSIKAIDELKVIMRPVGSILIAACAALASWTVFHSLPSALLRLIAVSTVLFGVYIGVLFFLMGQKTIYLALLRDVGFWPLAASRKMKKQE
jgi:O-antigen/teichoic acid export membrane protein